MTKVRRGLCKESAQGLFNCVTIFQRLGHEKDDFAVGHFMLKANRHDHTLLSFLVIRHKTYTFSNVALRGAPLKVID